MKYQDGYAIMDSSESKIKNKMQKIKTFGQIDHIKKYSFSVFCMVMTLLVTVAGLSFVQADQYDAKIRALANANSTNKDQLSDLGAQASSLSDAIDKLQAQINSKQEQINRHQAEVDKLKVEIHKAEIELNKQRRILGETIKTIYVEGDISTIEMLATSKNLSDFFDKQQYRESVRNKVKETLDTITQLKLDLKTRKEKTEKLINEQKLLQKELIGQRGEKDHLLSLNKNEQAALDSEIRSNNKKIAKLRSQQAAANARLFGGTRIIAGSNGRDTYPNKWRNAPQDSMIDSWGMYNRECVSYTAWKVYESGRFMPYWGGRGNANRWDDNARAAGIPVSSTPRAGDVAIWNVGYYGHAMYVESVNSNGTINVSQYNYSYNGTYSEAYNLSTSGLVFIHFR